MSELPYIGYVRISDLGTRSAGENLSSEGQIASIETTSDHVGVDIGWWVADEDVSGKNFDRVGWSQVLELIESGKAGGIVIWKQHRMSRMKAHRTMWEVEQIEDLGGRIYGQDGRISVATPDDQLKVFMNGWSDNREWEEKAAVLKQSVAKAIDRGAHLSAPYGYRKGERVASRAMPLQVNEDEAPAVKLMYKLRGQGVSWPKIAAALNASPYRPRPHVRKGERVQGQWRHQAVMLIVQSEVYLGVAFNGKGTLRTPGAHPAIVTPTVWAKANAVKGVRPVGPDGGYTLTGLVRCSSCGYVMVHQWNNGYGYWRCEGQGARGCSARVGVAEAALEKWVVDQFKEDYLTRAKFDPEVGDATLLEAQDRVEAAAVQYEAAMDAETAAVARKSPRAVEIAKRRTAAAGAELADAEQAHAEARAAALGADLPPELDAETFDAAPRSQQNAWLRLVYAFVVVRKDPVWRGPIADRATLARLVDVPGDPIAAAVGQ